MVSNISTKQKVTINIITENIPPSISPEKAFFQESAWNTAVIPISAKSLKGVVTEEISNAGNVQVAK